MLPSTPLRLPGCRLIQAFCAEDPRGTFVKFLQTGEGAPFPAAEAFVTWSDRGAVRGMHAQEPPHAHAKLVCCVAGRAFDVLTDLRAGAPTFGLSETLVLDASAPTAVLIPPGVAHGFQALEAGTALIYLTTSRHAPSHDRGVRWDSVGVVWPLSVGVLSERDAALPPLSDYVSPFRFGSADGA